MNIYILCSQAKTHSLAHPHKTTDNLAVTAIIKISPQSEKTAKKKTEATNPYIGIYRIYIYMYWYI